MKTLKVFPALMLMLLLNCVITAQETKVMFIGNSYTGANNLPNTFKELALSAGDSVFVDGSVIGGYTLGYPGQAHLTNPSTIEMIQRGYWDFVILQEQSQMPTIPYYRDGYTYPAAAALNTIIQENNACAQTVFFMTWGRKMGGQQCIGSYCSPVFVDYFHMQDSLETAYMNMTLTNDAMCAPVGISWSNSIANGDPIELFDTDGAHPSLAGTYLAACTFYAAIFLKTPVGLGYTGGLSQPDAAYLQQIAATTMADPVAWNIFPSEPVTASFTYELVGTFATFYNTSVNASFYQWDFGDPVSGTQNTSNQPNPNHQYSGPGTYNVTLVAGDSCRQDTAYDTIIIEETSLYDKDMLTLSMYPNPAYDVLNLQFKRDHSLSFQISSMDGRVCRTGSLWTENAKTQIKGLSALLPGVYVLQLLGKDIRLNRKILISSP